MSKRKQKRYLNLKNVERNIITHFLNLWFSVKA